MHDIHIAKLLAGVAFGLTMALFAESFPVFCATFSATLGLIALDIARQER